jgi:fructokinase
MRMIKAADILKLSDEDLEYLLPDTDIDAAFAEICDIATAGIIVLTRGSQGARVFHNGALFDVPSAVANPLVDTVGAGDTFMGTLLAEINQLDVTTAADLRRLDQQRVGAIISKAAIAAAKNCENAGCNPPYLHDLQ